MSETAHRLRVLEGSGVAVVERPGIACVNLRGDAANARFVRAVTSVTDVPPPTAPCTSVAGMFASILWLGPDEWLVTSETQRGDEIAERLRLALRADHAAVTETGDGRIVYALSGRDARAVLAKGCAIDFHARAFARGRCVQSLLAKTQALIHARVADAFDVYVARSVAGYVWDWLENAAAEYR